MFLYKLIRKSILELSSMKSETPGNQFLSDFLVVNYKLNSERVRCSHLAVKFTFHLKQEISDINTYLN